jgi:DNA-binding NarL/FixJ family response regulator
LEGTDLEVAGTAASGTEAVKMAEELKPDVVLLDIRMAEGDGLSALEKIHQELPECRVVMLSTYDNPTYIARANALGASDYLLKDTTREKLVEAINAVAAGEAPSSYGELRRVAGTMATRQKQEDA